MSAIQEFADLLKEDTKGGNIFGDAYRGVARKAKTLGKSALDLKDKIVKPIKKTAQTVVRKSSGAVIGKDRARRIERYGDAVLYNTAGLPPHVKEVLRMHGDEPISKIVIVRTPVQKLLSGVMNIVSLGSFNKKFGRLPYDDLFHLALFVTTSSGVYAIEKNEVIQITHNPTDRPSAEYEEVSPVKQGSTMNTLMTGSEKIQGKNWTKYDAYSNNCQDFVLSLLQGSGMGSAQDIAFVKQNTDTLFKNDTFLRKVARNLTNVGASVATAISGVDDKPIASTPTKSTFGIPSPEETDVKDGAGRGGSGKGKGSKGYRHYYHPKTPYTPEDLEVGSYLYPPAVYRDWNTMSAKEKREYLQRDPRFTPPPAPPLTASQMLDASREQLRQRIREFPDMKEGSGRQKMSPARRKAVIKEALEYLDGDLYKGFARDTNYYLRRARAVR